MCLKNEETSCSIYNLLLLILTVVYMLFRWRWNDTITEDKAAALTQQGINELKLLARRYKTKFPQLLNQPYNEQNYYVGDNYEII